MIYVGLDVLLNSAVCAVDETGNLSGRERRWQTRHRLCRTSNHGLIKLNGGP